VHDKGQFIVSTNMDWMTSLFFFSSDFGLMIQGLYGTKHWLTTGWK